MIRLAFSKESAMPTVLDGGVAGSAVTPQTTMGPAPAPVISARGSIESGKKVQKYVPCVLASILGTACGALASGPTLGNPL